MRLSVEKILSGSVFLILSAVIAIFFISTRQSRRVSNTAESITHTQLILSHLQKLETGILDNETSARGYAITGNAKFISSLRSSEQIIDNELRDLGNLVEVPELHRVLVDSLVPYCKKRMDFSVMMTKRRHELGFDSVAALVMTSIGIHYTERSRSLIDEIEVKETQLHEIRRSNNNRAVARFNIILYSLLASGFILSMVIIQSIRSGIRKQRLNEQKFIALLDAAPDATVIVNEKGIIQLVNQQVENLFGYKRNEMIGKPVEILIPEEFHKRHVGHRNGFIKEAGIRPMGAGTELKAIRKDRVTFPVEISLSPIHTQEGLLVSASIRDITNRKKSEDKFRSLLDSAPDATVIVDEKGLIQMVNHQAERLFGYIREDMIGKPVEILIPGELREKHNHHRGNFAKTAKVRTMGEGFELQAVKKNGSRFPVEISLSPIQTEEGMLVSASVRDISLRKELENELKKSNGEMEAFTYSVSHDLRAPLRGIIGFTAILEEEYASKLDDEAKRITSVIKANTLKMGHLIDDLLAFSRMGKQEIMKTDVNTRVMVKEIVDEITQQRESDRVKWDIRSLPPVKADINTFRQVWINLISNAVKYSANKKDPMIEVGSYSEDGGTVFYVKDNGVGFDEQYKHKLFRVFQRLHDTEQFEGTGVGLALVEKIISRHGGKVWAEGKEGKGACFYFSLPI